MKSYHIFLLLVSFILLFLYTSCNRESRLTESPFKANPYLSLEDARKEVESLLTKMPFVYTKDNDIPTKRVISSSWSNTIHNTRSARGRKETEFYIFNFADSLGFAIVCSDNRVGLVGASLFGWSLLVGPWPIRKK